MNFAYIKDFLVELLQRFKSHHVPDLSAQLSFYFLLSLFPFLIFTFSLMAYLPLSSEDVLSLLSQYVPAHSMEVIEKNVRNVLDVPRGGVLSLSIIFALWSASNGSYAIIRSLNHAYDVGESRPFLKARFVALFLTISMIFVIIVALLLPVFGRAIGLFVFKMIGLSDAFLSVWNFLRYTISFGVLFVVFSYLYYFAPNKKINIRDVWFGAFIATMGWQVISLAFSFYVNHFANFTAMYGSLGGIVGLLLWFFLAGMMLILGGEINATRQMMIQKRS